MKHYFSFLSPSPPPAPRPSTTPFPGWPHFLHWFLPFHQWTHEVSLRRNTHTHFLSTMLTAQLQSFFFFFPSLKFSREVCKQPDNYQTQISSLGGVKYLTAKSEGLVPVTPLDLSAIYEFFLQHYHLWHLPFFLFLLPTPWRHSPQLSPGASLLLPLYIPLLYSSFPLPAPASKVTSMQKTSQTLSSALASPQNSNGLVRFSFI